MKKEIKIGRQIWLTQNLNVAKFRNGDPIPEAKTAEEWERLAENSEPAWCYYDNDLSNGLIYGKLYNWFAVIDSRELAPNGWHIPSDDEWTILDFHLENDAVKSGKKIKSISGWDKDGNGNNESGFSGLQGGCRGYNGVFLGIGIGGYWWTTSEDDTNGAWGRGLSFNYDTVYKDGGGKGSGLSVRCLRN